MSRLTLTRNLNLLAILTTLLGLAFWVCIARGASSDCIDATCRVTSPDGARGTGCVFETSQNVVYVLTAAHVVGDHAAVQCEFWRQGHQSQPLPARVCARSEAADAAVLAVSQASFGNVLPPAIPLAPRDYAFSPGQTLTSAGCANGAWSTSWRGHALACDGSELRFVPPPANGRSGSAIFDAEGRTIVALLRARTVDSGQGIATPVQALYRAFDQSRQTPWGKFPTGPSRPTSPTRLTRPTCPTTSDPADPIAQHLTQCGPNGCRPEPWSNHLLPYRYRHEQQPQPDRSSPPQTPWPTLPEAAPAKPPMDLSPLDDKLGRIAGMLDDLKKAREAAPAAAPQPNTGPASPPLVDDQARKIAETALGQVAELRADSEKGLRDVKADAAKAHEAVGGLTAVVEKIKDSIAEDGTLSQRFHARMDKVRADLEEKLGREATDREVRIGYVKDLFQEKIADGGAVGLAKALGLPLGLVLIVWLITRDVKRKRETGDPLVVEKLGAMFEGRFASLQQRFESLRDRLHGGAEPPKGTGA
jgi:hypothetical protein